MPPQYKINLDDITKYILRIFASGCFAGLLAVGNDMRTDLKILIEERSGNVEWKINTSRRIEENKNSIDHLYNRLQDHENKHR